MLDRIVNPAGGRADRSFWRSIYKQNDGSGGPYVTGRINALVPCVFEGSGREPYWNQMVTMWTRMHDEDPGRLLPRGSCVDQLPTGISAAPFLWKYLGKNYSMRFHGGFVGAAQDPDTGAVRPAIGWAVAEEGG